MAGFILCPCCDCFKANCFNSLTPKPKEIWKLLQGPGAGKSDVQAPEDYLYLCCVGLPVTLHHFAGSKEDQKITPRIFTPFLVNPPPHVSPTSLRVSPRPEHLGEVLEVGDWVPAAPFSGWKERGMERASGRLRMSVFDVFSKEPWATELLKTIPP